MTNNDDNEKIIAELTKEFGKAIIPARNILNNKLVTIPFSPKIDLATGGGILEGTTTILSGQPKSGKTLSALHLCANCQKPEYGGEFCPDGRTVFIFNIEGRLRERDLVGIPNFDIEKSYMVQSEPGKILSAEDFLNIAEQTINRIPGSVILLDSASALCTNKERTSDMTEQQRADGAKLMYKFFRKVGGAIGINKNIVIAIQHMIANPGMGRSMWSEKGGQAVKYQVDTHLRILYHKPWIIGEDNQIGQIVNWQCITSPLGPPGKKFESYIRYSKGIDEIKEYISMGIDLGLITKAKGGGWLTLDYIDEKEPIKIQGEDNLRDFMENNIQYFTQLQDNIKEVLYSAGENS